MHYIYTIYIYIYILYIYICIYIYIILHMRMWGISAISTADSIIRIYISWKQNILPSQLSTRWFCEIFNSSILHFCLIMKHFLKWRVSATVFLKFHFYIYITYTKSFFKIYFIFSTFTILIKLISIILYHKIYHNWSYSLLHKTHEQR